MAKIMTTSSLKWYLRLLIIEKFVLSESLHSRGEADPRLCGCMNFVYKQGWSVTTHQTFEIILHKIAKIKTMKLSLSLLATASYGAPEKKKQRKFKNDRTYASSVPLVPCSTTVSDSWEISGGSPFKSIDNGQSGQVTFESYTNYAYCYVDIGSSCDANGLQVEITHMELETYTYNYYNYDTEEYTYYYYGCPDTIRFDWMSKNGETVEQTDPQCGCVAENHPSCNQHPFTDDYMAVTERPIQYNLVGTDVKLVLRSDRTGHGGKIEVDWKCNTPTSSSESKPVTNILEMANALLIGNFTPEMGRDYGCSGRGLFDPFAPTIGSHVDVIDAAFFTWKKCVQCASSNNKSNVLTYSYDVESDTCGK